jgi:SAM-dependent methyltransferase
MTLQSDYFDHQYAEDDDPWKISVGWYEHRKRAMCLAMLPQPEYIRVFEPACGNGDLTLLLADRCDELVAWDIASAAVDTARLRLADVPHATVEIGAVPQEWPSGSFDLIVLSEFGYYLDKGDMDALVNRLEQCLLPGGTVLAAHWRHDAPGYPLTGDEVHQRLTESPHLGVLAAYLDEDVRIDVFVRTPPGPRSVATQAGIR